MYEIDTQIGALDGSISGNPWKLKFPNNSLIDNLDGTYTLDLSAASIEYDFIDFDTSATSAAKIGRMRWNAVDRCLEFDSFINGTIVTNQVGQEVWVRVRNNTGSVIGNGKAVYVTGALGNRPTVALARADSLTTSLTYLGLTTQEIGNNEDGFVTVIGSVREVNTNSFTAGNILYLSPTTAGELTETRPVPPNNVIAVGICTTKSGNGEIGVTSRVVGLLNRLSDVNGSSVTTSGQVLIWDQSAKYWNASANITVNDSTRTLATNTGDLTINCGTGKTAFLTPSVYADIDFPIIIRTTGAGIPTLTTFNGRLTMPQWEVNDANQCESQEFIHEWEEGGTVYWHLHLNTNGVDTTDRYVRFELEYAYSVAGVWTFPAVVDTGDILIPANTPTKSQIIMSLANFTPTNSKIGDHAICYLKRIASTGAAPTNNPWIPMIQLHVKKNSLGSRLIATK